MSEAQQTITSAKNIYIVPSQSHEAIAAALALFYTLREQGKNVNVLLDKIPERLSFLCPSLDFISYPKNFVVSVPNNVASISQIYYEKTDDSLKIHLTVDKGNIKKDNVSFYFQEQKPDLVITVGIQDYSKALSEGLNSFGFLLEAPILNIDNAPTSSTPDGQGNKNFGKINIIEEKPLGQQTASLSDQMTKEAAQCVLTSLIIYTENFKNFVTADIFDLASQAMKKGADIKEISKYLY